MGSQVSDATENDVESLIEVYSSPDLYHNREEASWFVKSARASPDTLKQACCLCGHMIL